MKEPNPISLLDLRAQDKEAPKKEPPSRPEPKPIHLPEWGEPAPMRKTPDFDHPSPGIEPPEPWDPPDETGQLP